jgi:hypothetical protein
MSVRSRLLRRWCPVTRKQPLLLSSEQRRGLKTDSQKMDIKMDTKEYSVGPIEQSRNSLDCSGWSMPIRLALRRCCFPLESQVIGWAQNVSSLLDLSASPQPRWPVAWLVVPAFWTPLEPTKAWERLLVPCSLAVLNDAAMCPANAT